MILYRLNLRLKIEASLWFYGIHYQILIGFTGLTFICIVCVIYRKVHNLSPELRINLDFSNGCIIIRSAKSLVVIRKLIQGISLMNNPITILQFKIITDGSHLGALISGF